MPHITTLIANPNNPALSNQIAKTAASAIGSDSIYWLADGIACDIVVPEKVDFETVEATIRTVIAPFPIDVVVQNQDQRRCKALIADMDSTMIEQECIDELAAEIGIKAEISAITARAMNGEIPFEPALIERVALLKGMSLDVVERVIRNRISLTPGGKELVTTMRTAGAYTSLVSGGFTHFTRTVCKLLGFNEHHANILDEKDGKLTGLVKNPILGREAKVSTLQMIASEQGLSETDFIAVGDGANDLGMLKAAGTGVALHAKPSVAKAADMRIDHGDLTALLYIQGYRKSEFVA